MAGSENQSALLTNLRESLRHDSDIVFAVAFGSHVSGESHAGSDLDLAVKFATDLSSQDRFQKRCFLSGALQHEDAPFVDVSDIEKLPIEVAHDAVGGKFLCGDEQAFEDFKERIEASFTDEQDDLRRQHRDTIGRIAEEGLRG